MISREMLQDLFDDLAQQGEWDLSRPMVWGYFFAHDNLQRLNDVVPILQSRDYEFVGILEPEDADDAHLWYLHVQRVEVHSVDTLFARNEQLSDFAIEYGLDSYDGMDVGPVVPPARLA